MSDPKSRRMSAGLILIAVGLGLYLIDRVEGVGEEAVLLMIGLRIRLPKQTVRTLPPRFRGVSSWLDSCAAEVLPFGICAGTRGTLAGGALVPRGGELA